MKAAEALVAALRSEGVDTVFGIISIHMLEVYDAIKRRGDIRLVVPRHEQAAALMADGYARATGKVGVSLSSTGPGAANAVGGLFEAWASSSPVLHLTSQVPSDLLGRGKGPLHEAKDQAGMFRAVAGWVATLTEPGQFPRAVHEAFRRLRSGRPRPVVLELPVDLQSAEIEAPADLEEPAAAVPPEPPQRLVAAAGEMLRSAARPMILAGGGVVAADAAPELLALAERLEAPVLTTPGGRGAFPDDHPLALGNLLTEPGVAALLAESDVMLAVGTRLSGQPTGNWSVKLPPRLVHVDIDPEVIGRNYPAALGLVGHARPILARLLACLDGRRPAAGPPVRETVKGIRDAARQRAEAAFPFLIQAADEIRARTARDAVVVADATIPSYFAVNRIMPVYEPRTFMYPHGSNAIGPSVPLALGAKVGRPDRQVVTVVGDGGFMLNCAELATGVQERLGVPILLFNDRGYGILRRMQERQFQGRHIGVDLHTPDFAALARAFGAEGVTVETPAAMGAELELALERDVPTVIEVRVP